MPVYVDMDDSTKPMWSLQAPIYATLPVAKMSQLLMYSQRAAQRELSDMPPFSGEDIDAACELFMPLRYQQLVTLTGVRRRGLVFSISRARDAGSSRHVPVVT